jgi:hypothetical protein
MIPVVSVMGPEKKIFENALSGTSNIFTPMIFVKTIIVINIINKKL